MDNREIAPEEIRALRQQLDLTQVEAGELIGGGPRAFTKYEAGSVKPTAAVVNLLRLLEANPKAITTLKGGTVSPIPADTTSPFEVDGENIAALNVPTFTQLLRRLLNAEAHVHNLPRQGIHVASNVHTADGGEDGRIVWQGGPSNTPFVPSRLCQFQLKTGNVTPAKAGRDVLTDRHEVKEMVRSVLQNSGNYIMLCAHPYAQRQIEDRKASIRNAIEKAGLTIDDEQIDFRDADQIAFWVNQHPSVATWVKEQTQPGTIGPFRSWSHWGGRHEHDQSPWVEDERLPPLRTELRRHLTEPRKVVRVVGLSGVGKSRLVIEALRPTEEEEPTGLLLCDLVMYSVQSEVGSEGIIPVVQTLADSGARAVVVVDNCELATHQVLASMTLRQSSRLSLVTIDNEVPTGTLDDMTLKIDEANPSVIESIINQVSPGLQSEDQRRLVRFSKGFPKIAISIRQAWDRNVPIAHATEKNLVNTFVLGRKPQDPELLLQSSALLAVFGLVSVDPTPNRQLREIATLGRNLSEDDLYASIIDLAERGVARRRGRFVILQPRPIAMGLAERQWQQWNQAKWDRVLSGDINPDLKVQAAGQLALLNTTEIAPKVVQQVCRIGGPFDGYAGICSAGHARVLSALAAIDPEIVSYQIERSLSDVEDLLQIKGDTRRHLVCALEKIAFHASTFDHGARLLLRLALSENEEWSNNATGQFKALFQMFLGNTTADGDARLALLDDAAGTEDPQQRAIIAEALVAGSETHSFSRMVGVESQGSRPAMSPWQPATNKEVAEYFEGCVERLAQFAGENSKAGELARKGLGHTLRFLAINGYIDRAEAIVHQVTSNSGYWLEALNGLGDALTYHAEAMKPEAASRIRILIEELKPKDMKSRIRFIVSEMPWDYLDEGDHDYEARGERQVEAVRELAVDLLGQPKVLAEVLPSLSCDQHRMAYNLGMAMAELADAPLNWFEPIVRAAVGAPENSRNFDLLSGFVRGIAKEHSETVDVFKRRMAQTPALAPAFPQVCWSLGLTASDVQLAVEALQDGLLPPWRFRQWTLGRALAEVPTPVVAQLLDVLLDHSAEAYEEAVELMSMHTYGEPGSFEGLRPQILKAAANIARWKPAANDWNETKFEQILTWMLDKGREDPDARTLALTLAKTVANVEDFSTERLLRPVIRKLLSNFPEIVWPIIGQAIVSDERRAMLLELDFGDAFAFGRESNPVIQSLPEDTLFGWCHAYTEHAPAFAAKTVPVLAPQGDGAVRPLNPLMIRLLDEFGERDDVQRAVMSNIHTFGWSGSMTTYFAQFEEPLTNLLQHPKLKLRRWARDVLREIHTSIESARSHDEEYDAQNEI